MISASRNLITRLLHISSSRAAMSSSNSIKVFVYGTLKRGEPNHHWLTNPANGTSKFISAGKTKEVFPLVVGTRYNIPFLLNKKGTGNNIHGEIYEVDDSMFEKLDELEGYPGYYDREIQDINSDDGDVIPCWLYIIREYPESMLSKKLLTSYANNEEYPYCESIDDSAIEDLFDDLWGNETNSSGRRS